MVVKYTDIDKRFKNICKKHRAMIVLSCVELATFQGLEKILVRIKFYGT